MINDNDLKFRTTYSRVSTNVVLSLQVDAPTEFGYLKYYVLFIGTLAQEYFWVDSACK